MNILSPNHIKIKNKYIYILMYWFTQILFKFLSKICAGQTEKKTFQINGEKQQYY